MKIVLAYSGGLDTSVAARSLAEEHGAIVVAVAVDVGQGIDRDALSARAAAAGAELRIVDARDAFVAGYCWPALHANALYEGKYPLVSALARPLIASAVVRAARETGATAVAHGCTGKGNDQVRFETTFAALAPDLRVFAPVREHAMSRDEALEKAAAWGIPIAAESKVYSVDENLWGRTIECGPLEDPWDEPPADAFAITADLRGAPAEPEETVVTFAAGVPVALDGLALPGGEIIGRVAALGGRHGFGRVDMIENRLVGIKSRELYEVPGALALIAAHRDLEDLTLERDLAHEKAGLERRWAELAYYGQWHGPLHAALRAFMAETQADVTGDVRLRFHTGTCTVTGRRSERALYDRSLATYDAAADLFDHRQSEGFVRLWSLPIRTWAARHGAAAENAAQATPIQQPSKRPQPAPSPLPAAEPSGTGEVPEAPARPRPLWAGRFEGGPSEGTLAFTRSLPFDVRLAPHDLRATAAHVRALEDAGVVSADDALALIAELGRIGDEIAAGAFVFSDADEDVHSAVERALIERLGPVGARVHAARSRNDLVATDLRLWAADAAAALGEGAAGLAEALAERADGRPDAVLPGYTHLQRAQPVSLSHHLLAHAFALTRDAERLLRAGEGARVSSLGAGALAGSTIALATDTTAARLGLDRPFDNSIDAVADRDFALELLAACAIAAVHVSRLAEDVVLWCTEEFGFARPSEADATGSSMMPQKRNPDVAELARGKAGRVIGDLVALAVAMKGLPLAYNRDLQEDKEPLFDAHDTLSGALGSMAAMVRGLTFDRERMRAAVGGSLFATDVAELLVANGTPFREAHRAVGELVRRLEGKGRSIGDVAPDEWPSLLPGVTEEAAAGLTPEAAVARRATPGGPSAASVATQLTTLRARLRELRERAAAVRPYTAAGTATPR